MENIFSKKMVLTVLAFVVLSLAGTAAQAKMPIANAQCPVMTGERAKGKFFVDYQGERINFCCKSCIRRFNKNPYKYLAMIHPAK